MSQKSEIRTNEVIPLGQRFLERIGRPDLENRISAQTPYAYVCPEYLLDRITRGVAYGNHNGISHVDSGPQGYDRTQLVHPTAFLPDAAAMAKNGGSSGEPTKISGESDGSLAGAGGLGALGADTVLDAADTGINFDAVGILHTVRMHQAIGNVGAGNNFQIDIAENAKTPEELGLKSVSDLNISVVTNMDGNNVQTHLDVYDLHVGNDDSQTNIHLLYEPGLREVYPGQQTDDHRLYQMTVLGFGASQIWEQQAKDPAVLHLNESSTSLAAVGLWDRYMQKHLDLGMDPDEAFVVSLQELRAKTILTNHTLVPAAEAKYTKAQYEKYILPNIRNEKIRNRVLELMGEKGSMAILDLGMYLAGKFNGVSQLHAQLATQEFREAYPDSSPVRDGREPFEFAGETNAINKRWNEGIHELYRQQGILDEYDLPTPDYARRIEEIDVRLLRQEKARSKAEFREFIKTRKLGNNDADEHGKQKPLDLPDNALIIGWARRMAGYKRPGMLLDDLDQLKLLLKTHPEAHVFYSGKAHQTDQPMKEELRRILHLVQYDPELSKRIHYIQDYDVEVGRHLTAAADIWLNNPIVGREACGTSIFKAVKSNAILVSTPDGGSADVPNSDYMAIEGANYQEELASLYGRLDQSLTLCKASDDEWGAYIRRQLTAFMPIVAGGRMIKDYLNFSLPQEVPVAV